MSGSGRSWLVWAQGLEGLSPTQALVVGELARLADWRGVAVTSTAHLRRVSGRSRRAVFGALRGLEEAGVVVRERRRWGGHQACTWYRLQETGRRTVVGLVAAVPVPGPGRGAGEVARRGARLSGVVSGVIGRQENSRLRATVLEAAEEGWCGPAADLLGATLREAAVGVQFSVAVRRRMRSGGLGREEAAVEVASIAWELLRENAASVAGAEVPWARLTAIVGTAVLAEGQRLPEGVSMVAADPADLDLVEGGSAVGRAVPVGAPSRCQEVRVGYDDFGPVLLGLVESLLGAGLDETVTWAGTLRVAELATRSPSRRHTLAGEDPRLAELGVSAQAARAWMTLLVGSRRGAVAPVVALDPVERDARARAVVHALRDTA